MGARIVVIGGGIGGLAAASTLTRAGSKCVVLERNRALPGAGGGIQISPNGAAVLHRLGLAAALSGAFRPAARELRRWRDDRLISEVPLGEEAVSRYGSPYYTLRRATLCRVLLDEARRHADVRFGQFCAGVDDRGDRVVVRLGDGSQLIADAVVGADGLHSRVRRSLIDDRVRFGGWAVYRAIVGVQRLPRHPNRVIVRLGPGRHCVSYPLDNGRGINVVAAVPASTPPAPARDVPAGEVLAAFAGWHPAVHDLLAAAGRFDRHGLFDRTRPVWGRGRVALLGDAAHPLLPFLAQGASQALEDAAALADGFGGYPAARAARVAGVAAACLAAARDHHLPDGPDQRTRDGRLAAAGLPAMDWLYGSQPAVRA